MDLRELLELLNTYPWTAFWAWLIFVVGLNSLTRTVFEGIRTLLFEGIRTLRIASASTRAASASFADRAKTEREP